MQGSRGPTRQGEATANPSGKPSAPEVGVVRWKRTRNAAERLPSEVAKASKEIPSQERRQICINRAMPADFSHHAVKELEPLAIIYCQWPAAVVESRCGAVVLGSAYLLPALSVAGASLASPWLRFHIPLSEPDVPY